MSKTLVQMSDSKRIRRFACFEKEPVSCPEMYISMKTRQYDSDSKTLHRLICAKSSSGNPIQQHIQTQQQSQSCWAGRAEKSFVQRRSSVLTYELTVAVLIFLAQARTCHIKLSARVVPVRSKRSAQIVHRLQCKRRPIESPIEQEPHIRRHPKQHQCRYRELT